MRDYILIKNQSVSAYVPWNVHASVAFTCNVNRQALELWKNLVKKRKTVANYEGGCSIENCYD